MQPIVELRGNLDAIKREEENIYPLVRMERVGFKIDYDYLVTAKEKLKEYTRQRRQDLCQIAGTDIKYRYFFIGRMYQMLLSVFISYILCLIVGI